MADAPDPIDLPVVDLHTVVDLGLERGGWLLSAGEHTIVRRIRALKGPPARLYARLSARVPEVFEVASLDIPGVDDAQAALETLLQAELIDHLVPWPTRARHLTIPRLKRACADLGLRRGGKKADLVARLAPHRHFAPGPWIRVRHRGLIRRLERWAFMRRHRDRSTLVVERLGHTRWPVYTPTPGRGVHADRAAMLRWEALLGELDVPTALDALRQGHCRAGGPLDLTRRLTRSLADHARALERTDPGEAVALYAELATIGFPADPVRHARALEQAGDRRGALAWLRGALETERGPHRLAIHRAGRRLARALRMGWAPDPPLLEPRKRTIRLLSAPSQGPRPLYRTDARHLPVEAALIAELAALGRRAFHAENALWTTLFALCFAHAYFEPIPGALPCRWLSGPLDVGGPSFYRRRKPVIDPLVAALRAGEGPDRIAENHAQYEGVRLAGASWELPLHDLVEVAQGLGGEALATVLQILLQQGWRSARGLPDLAILPGISVELPTAVPRRLGPGLVLAEVKGPGDTVRDAQRLWFHRLRSAGASIALWEVRPLDAAC